MYIDKLDNIAKNTTMNIRNIKPVDVKSKTYINFSKENNYKYVKFKVDN